jgi:hypothetical protein
MSFAGFVSKIKYEHQDVYSQFHSATLTATKRNMATVETGKGLNSCSIADRLEIPMKLALFSGIRSSMELLLNARYIA